MTERLLFTPQKHPCSRIVAEIARRIRSVAEKYHPWAACVFGSYARGEAGEDSNVDLLADTTGSGLVGWEYGGLYNDLAEALGKELDMITAATLNQPIRHESDIYFRENIRRERSGTYAAA